MGVGAPSGTVTFLFTDIEGSTRLWQGAPEAMRQALARHDAVILSAVEAHGGYVFSTGGDGFGVAFARSGEALAAAAEAQAALDVEPWPSGAQIRVRMALHTGEAEERDGDYFGIAVNRTARLMAAGHGGQVLVSSGTAGVMEPGGLVDLGVHRLKDLSAPERVFQLGDGRFPPLRSLDAVPGNLPSMLTDLVGRAEDIADLVAVMERERLVTLIGPGGVGKTSLALAAAAVSAASFPDGCWFAQLASASTEHEVVRAVASAMGITATDTAGLVRFLTDRRVLILLDNAEHVLSDAANLVNTLLSADRDVVVVVTSQAPLGVRAEVVREVTPLAVPRLDTNATEAIAAPAVGLFVARATAASQRFALNESNVDAVVDICRQLDGIPLAIELAAARVRAMSPAEIARRLQGWTFGAVSWSHDLLSDDEKVVFRRLAVFPASFDLAAAEAVAGHESSIDVVDCVTRLVDRSMVVYDPGDGRYQLLETLRRYAADRLTDAAEAELARDRHIDFFVALAASVGSNNNDPRNVLTLGLDPEIDNLRAVAHSLRLEHRWRDLLKLGRHLFLFMLLRAPAEAYGWYRSALEHLPDLDVQERVDALGEMSSVGTISGQSSDDTIAGSSIALAGATGILQSPQAWITRAIILNAGGDPIGARAVAEQAVTVSDERGDPFASDLARSVLANILARLGELDLSSELAIGALRRARLSSHPDWLCMALTGAVGSYLTNRADPDFAAGMQLLESNPVAVESVSPGQAVWLERMWGLANLGLGKPHLASQHLARSLRRADQIGQGGVLADAVLALAVAVAEAGRPTLGDGDGEGENGVGAQLVGYANTHLFSHSLRDASYAWLHTRLSSVQAATGEPEWTAATEAGAQLHRRDFMRLLENAEQSDADTDAVDNR